MESDITGEPSHMMSPVVRQARLTDQDAIAAFVKKAYGNLSPYKNKDRWNWQFVANPFTNQSDGSVPVFIALEKDDVVGQIAVQESRLQIDMEVYSAGWIVDVIILPQHRGRGLGHKIHDLAARNVSILVTLTMAPATRRIAEKAGAITVGPVHQLTRWVRLSAPTVRRYLVYRTERRRALNRIIRLACDLFFFHHIFASFINPMLWVRDLLWPVYLSDPFTEIEEVPEFGPQIDELWSRTRRDYKVIVPRTSKFLNWRFRDCPHLRYRRFVAKRDGQVKGYLVLRRSEHVELPLGVIVDLYTGVNDRETLQSLSNFAIGFFGNDVEAIDGATSVPQFLSVYKALGFFETRIMRPTFICQDTLLHSRVDGLQYQCFFSKADHDWDQIHIV